jgi:conjugal transfer pilus assembly protein TraE
MQLSSLINNWRELNKTVATMLLANVFLALALMIAIARISMSHERVVLVPPNLTESAQIAWKNASGSYYKAWGLYIATLIGNLTPNNVRFIVDSLSHLFSAELYTGLREKLISIAEDETMRRAGATNYFSPNQAIYEPSTQKTYILGNLTLQYRNRQEIKPVVYEMRFDMQNGVPIVKHFTSYEGNEARTEKWKRAHMVTDEEKPEDPDAQDDEVITDE